MKTTYIYTEREDDLLFEKMKYTWMQGGNKTNWKINSLNMTINKPLVWTTLHLYLGKVCAAKTKCL